MTLVDVIAVIVAVVCLGFLVHLDNQDESHRDS